MLSGLQKQRQGTHGEDWAKVRVVEKTAILTKICPQNEIEYLSQAESVNYVTFMKKKSFLILARS